MKNSTELCENVSVSDSKNINNSEIEATTIEEVKNISEEVSNKHSEIKEMEVKTLDKNKPFKWTNEATKAAACMLKDIIDEYNKANSDLSSSLDENTDPWGFDKLNEQMKVLKQSIELDLYPKEWCRYKLASLIKKYFDEHTKSIENVKFKTLWYDDKNNYNFLKKDFNLLYIILSQIGKYRINFQEIVRRFLEGYYDKNDEHIFYCFNFCCESDDYRDYVVSDFVTPETISAGVLIEDIYYSFIERKINSANLIESSIKEDCETNNNLTQEQKEDFIKIKKFINIPSEFQFFYLEELFREKIFNNLPNYKDISKFTETSNDKFVGLLLVLAAYSYKNINFLTLADMILSDEINNIKGLKETYSEMFEE